MTSRNDELPDAISNPPMHSTASAPVTIRDIARACQVSKTTVSVALYGDKPIKASTRQRILEVARAMGYVPEQQVAARRLAARKSDHPFRNHLIGIFIELHFTRTEYFRDLYEGIASVLIEHDFSALLTHPHRQNPGAFPRAYAQGDIDGCLFVVSSTAEETQHLRQLPGFATRPIVTLLDPVPTTSTVCTDDRAGTYAATRHLLALGHRHFLHLYMPLERTLVINRITGIQDALTEAGLDPAIHLSGLNLPSALLRPHTAPRVLPLPGVAGQQVTLGADILLPYLHAHPEITAIFCENDAMAMHLWHMLHNAGYQVPADISLIGFDDDDGILDATGTNHLTTIRLPLFDMGAAAAELLIQRITGQLTQDEQHVLTVEFIARHSTAPPHKSPFA